MKKQYRIRKNLEFQRIIKTGRRKVTKCYSIYYADAILSYGRVGISVSKKLGNAVMRNKIKRQVRMMFHQLASETINKDLICIVRSNYLNNSYEENKKDLSVVYNSVYNEERRTIKEKFNEEA